VRAIFRIVEFGEFLSGNFIIPEVYLYCFDALPILVCTCAFSVILPWQLDYAKAVGDVLEKLEWGLLFPIVWPVKILIRRRKEKMEEKAGEVNEATSANGSTHELHELPK
jgi:RTA1 like protein